MFGCLKSKAVEEAMEDPESASASCGLLRAISWTGVAVGITALGLYVGRELRLRYKIRHRTPTDLFAHAGEKFTAEYGVGI